MTELLDLAADLPITDVPAGEILIEEGTRPGRLFVLASGELVVEHGGVPFARVDHPGAVIGEMSAILGRPATATVRAAGEARVHVVEDAESFLTQRPGAALAVLRTTASRLDGMTQYLVDVKRQYADAEGHLAMVDRILDTLLHHQGPPPAPGSRRDPDGDHSHEDEGL